MAESNESRVDGIAEKLSFGSQAATAESNESRVDGIAEELSFGGKTTTAEWDG
jgi:IMP cyclohydrolase